MWTVKGIQTSIANGYSIDLMGQLQNKHGKDRNCDKKRDTQF